MQVAAALALLGAHDFGRSSPAWEIPEAMRRAIDMGQRDGPESVISTIGMIEAQARNELDRINSLERACATADDRENLVAAFLDHGLALRFTSPVKEKSGHRLADFLMFS